MKRSSQAKTSNTESVMRYIVDSLEELAKEKFVLLSGPRQVGKTTLAKNWLDNHRGLYLNWDSSEDRDQILRRIFIEQKQKYLVLDELHKYSNWKTYLKGLFDVHHQQLSVLVTGSGKLDVYKKGGDSMMGRYESIRLHPFSIGELSNSKIITPPKDWLKVEKSDVSYSIWEQLEKRGGFPEPFTKDSDLQYRRWQVQRRNLIIDQDIRDLTQIHNLSVFEHLAIILPTRIGSLLSLNSIREELSVAFTTVSSWLEVLERLYYCFRISPYSKKIGRALRKEQKLYMWDWSQVEDAGARFENMVASHLLKNIHLWNDLGYGEYDLHYIRTKEKYEIDFLITEKRKPLVLIEAKVSDESLSPSFAKIERFFDKIPKIQLVNCKEANWQKGEYRVISAARFFGGLN